MRNENPKGQVYKTLSENHNLRGITDNLEDNKNNFK